MRNFDRSERLFGKEGVRKIRATVVAVVGNGGLGTHVIQQTALLGSHGYVTVDDQVLADTDLNRYIGVTEADVGKPKVDLTARLIRTIEPDAEIYKVHDVLASPAAFREITRADVVFGCLDNEGARLILTELCAAYGRPLFDLASDIETHDVLRYGGRVVSGFVGRGCLVCLGEIDLDAAREDLSTPAQRLQRDALYGIKREYLDGTGPAVASINGVVASLAVTEFMVYVTGIRPPQSVLTYRGDLGKILARNEAAPTDCYYCHGIWNQRERAGVERYLD